MSHDVDIINVIGSINRLFSFHSETRKVFLRVYNDIKCYYCLSNIALGTEYSLVRVDTYKTTIFIYAYYTCATKNVQPPISTPIHEFVGLL